MHTCGKPANEVKPGKPRRTPCFTWDGAAARVDCNHQPPTTANNLCLHRPVPTRSCSPPRLAPTDTMMRLDASACMEPFSEYNSRKSAVCGLIFRVDDPGEPHAFELDRSIQRAPGGTAEQDWAQFCAELPADDCRIGLATVSWQADDGHRASKPVFLLWSPSKAPIKTKMIYSASSASLKTALQGAGIAYQAGDTPGLDWTAVVEKAKSATTAR